MKTKVHTGHAPAAIGPYAQGIIHNSVIYTSGQLLRDPHEFSPRIQCCNSSYPASVYSGARCCATVLL